MAFQHNPDVKIFFLVLLISYVLCLAPWMSGRIAQNNNRGFWGWYLAIVFLSVFGLWHMMTSFKHLSISEIRTLKLLAVGYFLLFCLYRFLQT